MTALTLSRPGAPAISYSVHRPKGAPTGAVLLTHGYAEHAGRYDEVVDALVARSLIVARYDLRGHGHSEGPRGHVERFTDYIDDATALLGQLGKDEMFRGAGSPVILGHSLGGLISFHLALSDPGAFRAVVLSSPFFGLALAVPAVKRLAGRVLSRIVPTFGLPSGLRGADLTHDAAKARAYDEDPMLVPKATARWFTEAMKAQADAFERAPSMLLPIAIFAGGEDKVASTPAAEALFARVGAKNKRFEALPGQFHEIFNEVERPRWIAMAADAVAGFAGG
jgi:alpha-beta hydrolase superfamily lysophospholipase